MRHQASVSYHKISIMVSAVCLVLLPLTFSFVVLQRYRQQKAFAVTGGRGCKEPPYLRNGLVLGLDRILQILQADSEGWLMELFSTHFKIWGPTLKHKFLGAEAIGTIEPQNLRAMLSTHFEDWSLEPRPRIMGPLFGRGIFTQSGASWSRLRNMFRGQLAARNHEDCTILAAPMDNLLRTLSESGGTAELQPYILTFTLEVMMVLLFGEQVMNDLMDQEFSDAFNDAQATLAKRMRLPGLYWLYGGHYFRRSCTTVKEYVDRYVGRYLSDSNDDPHLIRDQVINLLVAGRDTTASLIMWTIFLLVRHPDILAKLRQKISNSFLNNGSLTRSTLRACPYLQQVLRETLRLYPPVPVNSRMATRDTTLPTGGGTDHSLPILVPEGTTVAYSVYAMHRRPELYGTDAAMFRPERWTAEHEVDGRALDSFEYLPFNGGPRVCLGMDFALTEAAYCIVQIIRTFPHIHLPKGQEVSVVGWEKQSVGLVMFSADRCRVTLMEE